MAEDIKKVIKVEVGDSQTTIKSLRKEMGDLRDTILNLDSNSEEYAKAVEKLQSNQQKLNDVMKLSKKAVGDNDNALKKLREQIKQYRNDVLNAEEGTEEWTKAMQNLSNASFQLRDMNEQARYSVDDLGEQLANVNTIATGVVGGFNALQGAVVLFGGESENLEKIMVRLQAGIAIVQGMQGLEGMKDSLVGLSNVLNSSVIPATKNFIKSIGKTGWIAIIAVVITSLISLVDWLKKTKDGVNGVTDAYDKLSGRFNSHLKSVEELEREQEREIKLLKAQGATEEEIIQKKISANERYRDLIVQIRRDLQRQLDNVEGEEKKKYQALYDDANARYYHYVNEIADLQNDLQVLEIQAGKTSSALGNVSKTSLPPEGTITGDGVKFDDGNGKIADKKFDTSSNGATAKYDNALYAKELTFRKEMTKAILLDDEERYARELELTEKFNNDRMQLLNEAIAREKNVELKGSLILEKAELEIQIEEEKNARIKEINDKAQEQRKAAIQQTVQAISSLFGSLADIYESGDKENEKNAKKAKQLRIAQATIDTLYGSVTAYMTTLKAFPAPFNIPLAVLNAGTVLASGMATIAKIKSQDPIKGGGSGASVTPTQTYSTAMPMTADNQATNLQNIDAINTDSKVYILQSDLEDSHKQVEIREDETTF